VFRTIIFCLFAAPLLAQPPQIGGGTCSSSSLNGSFALTLNGRDVNSTAAFSAVVQGVGTASFDGLSKVTFTLTNNTNKVFGMAQTLSGTYSLQSNCIGTISITSGDMATFTLESYNQGRDFLFTGQDGTYAFMGNGSALPATCPAATALTGVYAFNGTGFLLTSGAITGVNDISGLITFNGASAVTARWNVTSSGTTLSITTTGSYAVTTGCAATGTVTDAAGNSYSLTLTITSANGSNFSFTGANSQIIFTGAGRIL
jgi:hypothetical protein